MAEIWSYVDDLHHRQRYVTSHTDELVKNVQRVVIFALGAIPESGLVEVGRVTIVAEKRG